MTDQITIPSALLKQALEALEIAYSTEYDGAKMHAAKLAIRAELAKPTPSPAWHDAPTCAGLWLCFENGYAYAYPEEWDKGFAYGEDSRWYGPIPQDGEKS